LQGYPLNGTIFDEMHLFNDVSQKHDTSFILNRRSGESARHTHTHTHTRTHAQREREKGGGGGGVWAEKGCSVAKVFMRVQRQDNPRIYQYER
jgi:hypothetical protein